MHKRMENAYLFMWITAATATLGSLYFSEVKGFIPCSLCWVQRAFMYPQVLMIAYAIWKKRPGVARLTLLLSALGGAVSAYHYGLQKLPWLRDAAPSCGRIPCTADWLDWFGFLTIPLMALTAFAILIACSAYVLKLRKEASH